MNYRHHTDFIFVVMKIKKNHHLFGVRLSGVTAIALWCGGTVRHRIILIEISIVNLVADPKTNGGIGRALLGISKTDGRLRPVLFYEALPEVP